MAELPTTGCCARGSLNGPGFTGSGRLHLGGRCPGSADAAFRSARAGRSRPLTAGQALARVRATAADRHAARASSIISSRGFAELIGRRQCRLVSDPGSLPHGAWAQRARELADAARGQTFAAGAAAERHERLARDPGTPHAEDRRRVAALYRDAEALHEQTAELRALHAEHERRVAARLSDSAPGSPWKPLEREEPTGLGEHAIELQGQPTLADDRTRAADIRERAARARERAADARDGQLGERERQLDRAARHAGAIAEHRAQLARSAAAAGPAQSQITRRDPAFDGSDPGTTGGEPRRESQLAQLQHDQPRS
jgi:hypothetical protein